MSIVVRVWKCRSRVRVDPLQHVPEERRDVVDVEVGSSSFATMNRYFASDSCPCPRIAFASVSSSCGRRVVGVGHVPLAADRQQQRVHAGRIDGVDRVHAGDHGRDDRPGQLVDELAERWCLPAAAGRRP